MTTERPGKLDGAIYLVCSCIILSFDIQKLFFFLFKQYIYVHIYFFNIFYILIFFACMYSTHRYYICFNFEPNDLAYYNMWFVTL